ncbi:MAG: hypothetical protein JW818_22425, partial [Pirellulales bacterium]|nr:hypothetical protein [Pirellulales bacterium]
MKTSSRLIVSAVVVGLGTWMFADVLFADRLFGFRDAAHFYYPLFQFIQDQWAAGHVPVWNPYENGGVPLAGDLAASVFYPGKLIFALPIGFAWAYKVYIIGHMLLAVFWAYRLARAWRASVEAAGLCAISYAFSGNILYQYINVIYLVGAAWFPAALLAADHMLRRRSPRWAILFGVTLALMTLGGDPQAAYHAGLLAGLYGLILWRWRRRTRRAWKQARGSGERKGAIEEEKDAARDELQTALTPALSRRERGRLWLRSTPVLLAMAGAVAFVLAAVQVLPSMVMTR